MGCRETSCLTMPWPSSHPSGVKPFRIVMMHMHVHGGMVHMTCLTAMGQARARVDLLTKHDDVDEDITVFLGHGGWIWTALLPADSRRCIIAQSPRVHVYIHPAKNNQRHDFKQRLCVFPSVFISSRLFLVAGGHVAPVLVGPHTL